MKVADAIGRVTRRNPRLVRCITWLAVIAALAAWALWAPFGWLGRFYGDFVFPVTFFACIGFCLWYTLTARWWHNMMGRMLWWVPISVAAILFDSVLINNFHARLSPILNLRVQSAGVLVAGVVVVCKGYLLIRAQGWRPHWPWNLRNGHDDDQK